VSGEEGEVDAEGAWRCRMCRTGRRARGGRRATWKQIFRLMDVVADMINTYIL